MIAEIISIGTEITSGSTLNTNSSYISQKLLEHGIETHYHTSVDDNEERLSGVINTALNRSNLIITTGGLGPTEDDLTREVFSKVLNQDLIIDYNMRSQIENYFLKNNRTMTKNNIKQAKKFSDSVFLENPIGTAPGIYLKINNVDIFLLPGPPREMKLMLENCVLPLLVNEDIIITKSINTVGIGESTLETELLKMNLATDNTTIATFAKEGTLEIKITSKGIDRDRIQREVNNIVSKINLKFDKYIYGYNNTLLEDVVVKLLIENNFKIGICESCTGGLISSKITSIAGASKVFERGIVSYSNKSKFEELNVSKNTLERFGAVSRETVIEMAQGLMDKTKLDIVLSVTGIAGPEGGTKEKPVGLVYFCVLTKNHKKVIKTIFNGNRNLIQTRAAIMGLNEIRNILLSLGY